MISQMPINVSNLRIYYQNVRGLRTKLNLIFNSVLSENYDLVILTESSLLPGIFDREIIDLRYVVFRHDRDLEKTGQTRGGGVLIAVKKDIEVERLSYMNSELEAVWLRLNCHSKIIYLAGIYIPPSSSLEKFEILFNLLYTNINLVNSSLLMIGDFNLPGLFTNPDNLSRNVIEREFMNMVGFYNLTQYNNIVNAYNGLLDLVLSNISISVVRCGPLLLVEDAYHLSLVCLVN